MPAEVSCDMGYAWFLILAFGPITHDMDGLSLKVSPRRLRTCIQTSEDVLMVKPEGARLQIW